MDRLEGLPGLEGRARDDHAGTVGEAGDDAHDHAEGVEERHRGAHAVLLGVAEVLADEEAVVEDVAVRQGRTLREAGGAGGELDVDGVVVVQVAGVLGEVVDLAVDGVVPVGGAEVDDVLQLDATLLASLVEHGAVVGVLEAWGREDHLHADLGQDVVELALTVGRVDVHQDETQVVAGPLDHEPLPAVR